MGSCCPPQGHSLPTHLWFSSGRLPRRGAMGSRALHAPHPTQPPLVDPSPALEKNFTVRVSDLLHVRRDVSIQVHVWILINETRTQLRELVLPIVSVERSLESRLHLGGWVGQRRSERREIGEKNPLVSIRPSVARPSKSEADDGCRSCVVEDGGLPSVAAVLTTAVLRPARGRHEHAPP